jgi:hypothetical protein
MERERRDAEKGGVLNGDAPLVEAYKPLFKISKTLFKPSSPLQRALPI